MSTFYFSGIEKRATAKVLGDLQASGMLNRLEYSTTLMETCNQYGLRLVMDCGSFTRALSQQDIQAYAQLINGHGDRFEWYANPDVIGDQELSNQNYAYLLSLLPAALHHKVLWIYQYGADISFLYKGLQQHRRLGIGGLVSLIQADRERARNIILSLAGAIAQHDCLPHYFGLSSVGILDQLHQYHRSYSVDSTTWLMGGRYGLLINAAGQQRPAREGGYDWDTESILKQNVRTMRKWVEGVPTTKKVRTTFQLSFNLFSDKKEDQDDHIEGIA